MNESQVTIQVLYFKEHQEFVMKSTAKYPEHVRMK